MRVQIWLLSVLLLAHSALTHGYLKILGGFDAVSSLRLRAALPFAPWVNHVTEHRAKDTHMEHLDLVLDERAVNSRCGFVNGSCPDGQCCSVGGYCGKEGDFHYCSGPACQLNYGDKCDGNISPLGTSTQDVPRPHLGNLSYGGLGEYYCLNKSHVALTFDDGPYIYTEHVLDVLDQYNAKATFFITGNNMGKGQIDDPSTGYPQFLKRMHDSGHQIASHTWTHQNLTNLTVAQRQNQVYYNEMAFRNVLGFFPTYLRPPYSECDNDTQDMLSDMGYHIIYYNIDSSDYLYDDPNLIQNSKDAVNVQFATVNVTAGYPADFIIINHDIHEQTAYNLTAWELDRMLALNFGNSVTVGECLGDPPENWYRNASGAPVGAAVSESLANVTPTPIPDSGPSLAACLSTATVSCKVKSEAKKVDSNLVLFVIALICAGVQTL